MIPHDVTTRWNSTFDMLNFTVKHITVINTITRDRDMKLRQYKLSEGDWDIARQLRDVLKVCSYAQLFLSLLTITLLDLQGRHPLFFTTDPQHRHCHTSYGPHQQTSHYGCYRSQIPSCNQGCACNKKTLNHYYDKTNHSEVFRIVMGMDFLTVSILFPYILLVLHPQHKLNYFKNTGWKDEWIERAKEIVRMEFNKFYGSLDASWSSQLSKPKVCAFGSPPDLKVLHRCPLDHFICIQKHFQ